MMASVIKINGLNFTEEVINKNEHFFFNVIQENYMLKLC